MYAGSNRAPITFSVVLFAAVAALGAYRVVMTPGAGGLVVGAGVVAYLAWVVVESWSVSLREVRLPPAPSDRGSCELYAVAQGATVLVALAWPGPLSSPVPCLLGLALMLAGVAVRLSAIATLGRYYSRRVRLLPEHQVITSGPYRLVRHPAYAGTLAAHLGLAAMLVSPAAALLWAVVFVPMVVRRILLEERVLAELADYAAYARTLKRLVPLVW